MSDKKFVPQKKNANRHTLHGLRLLEKSIQQDGFIDAQTAAADGEIISGSARLELSAEKFADVEPIVIHSDGSRPVIVVRDDIPDASDPRARRLSIAANQIGHTDWNPDGDLLREWGNEDADIKAMFAADEWREVTGEEQPSADAEPQIDRAAELLEKWQVTPGSLWAIGDHRLICGDCTDAATVARVMDGEKAGACVTDPPYGMNLDTDYSGMESEMFKGKTGGKYHAPVIGDDTDYDPSPIFKLWDAPEVFLWGADYYAERIPSKNNGSWLVWDKRLDESADKMYGSCFELCWSKQKHKRDVIRVKWAGIFGMESQDTKTRQHPTQKAVGVIEWIVDKYTSEGDIVTDPYVGSGTCLVACQNLSRRCRAIEISPAYVAVALERMATAFPGIDIRRLG